MNLRGTSSFTGAEAVDATTTAISKRNDFDRFIVFLLLEFEGYDAAVGGRRGTAACVRREKADNFLWRKIFSLQEVFQSCGKTRRFFSLLFRILLHGEYYIM
jgi:hypothetical protein